jgi:hypothetical protein
MTNRLRFAILLAALLTASASGQPVNEYQMKAAYVYNLAKFVEWPAGAFRNATDPIAICVLGQSPIQNLLEDAVRGEAIDNRKLTVHRLSDIQQAGACHILFIAPPERKQLRSILRELQTPGVLTVGEMDGFLEEGGAVNFSLEGNRIRIDINISAAGQQKLRISPKLLSLARIVKK